VSEEAGRAIRQLRGGIARAASLRWARIGRFDPVLPAAALLTAAGFRDQLGATVAAPFGLTFAGLWVGLAAVSIGALWLGRKLLARGAGKSEASASWPLIGLIVWIVSGWLVCDLVIWQGSNHLYDLDVYLASAGRWMNGGTAYMTGPESSWPASAAQDYFLYPPPLLPVFGLLSRLPGGAVTLAWEAFLAWGAYASFRTLGLRWFWSLALLAFPPLMRGFESGNVASLTFLLFALGYRAGGSLLVGAPLKVQLGIPVLWLVRSRRWRGIVFGALVLVVIVLATLPIVGLESWRAWIASLGYRAQSQALVPSLYGYSFARVLPAAGFAALALLAAGLALLFSGRRGLAATGLASIVAAPALWPHGFVFALPAVLQFESGALVWLVLGAAATGVDMWLLYYMGWVAVLAAERVPDHLHPLAGTDGPWPRALALPTSRPDESPEPAGADPATA
jgi:hypothetical protein